MSIDVYARVGDWIHAHDLQLARFREVTCRSVQLSFIAIAVYSHIAELLFASFFASFFFALFFAFNPALTS